MRCYSGIVNRPRLLRLPVLAFTLLLPAVLPSAPPKSPPKQPAAQPGKTAAANKQAAVQRSRSSKKKAPARAQGFRQLQPEPQRIRDIQEALARRGYAVEPTGVWDAATVEALKKFQEDHEIKNLSGRGRLDPLTLTALGLGPAHTRPAPSGAAAAQNPTEGIQP